MTATDTRSGPPTAWIAAAMQAVELQRDGLVAAKRTKSVASIGCAQRELQSAVDTARDLDVEWGQIGAALGMARGNAYQRFRRKSSTDSRQVSIGDRRYSRP